MAGHVSIDVGQEDFDARVLQASRQTPVVVDFWADWCQPCRILSPVLERLAAEYEGRFVLVKVDVDANPVLAGMFGIQGIPAVKAFRDGEVVAEFVGVQPESVIRRFLDQIAPDVAALEPARTAEEAGDFDEAERLYRQARTDSPGNGEATLGLARVLLARGATQEARSLLGSIPSDDQARRLLAELELHDVAAGSGELAIAAGAALAADYRGALEGCLRLIVGGGADREPARELMVAIFDVLGDEHLLTREYRPRLASALF